MSRADRVAGRNAVIMYHSVGEKYPDGDIHTSETFRRQMEYLTENFRVVDIPDVFTSADTERRVALTFDSGYKNFYTEILPVLEEYDLPATQFVIPERIGIENNRTSSESLGMEWFDFMNENQLSDLTDSDLVTIGNKSLTHTSILPMIRDEQTLRREVGGGKDRLQELFGISPDRFCYGSGRYDSKSVEVVGEYHQYAVATLPRLVDDKVDPLRIPRIDMDLTGLEEFQQKLTRRYEFQKQINTALSRVMGSWYPDGYERLRENE